MNMDCRPFFYILWLIFGYFESQRSWVRIPILSFWVFHFDKLSFMGECLCSTYSYIYNLVQQWIWIATCFPILCVINLFPILIPIKINVFSARWSLLWCGKSGQERTQVISRLKKAAILCIFKLCIRQITGQFIQFLQANGVY